MTEYQYWFYFKVELLFTGSADVVARTERAARKSGFVAHLERVAPSAQAGEGARAPSSKLPDYSANECLRPRANYQKGLLP